jgi:integrase
MKLNGGRPRKGPRYYPRTRGGVTRYYGDFRNFADVLLPEEGKGRMPLIADGDSQATADPEVAQTLFLRKLEELRERKRTKVATGRWKKTGLGPYAKYHLETKAEKGQGVERWLQSVQKHLEEAVSFFGVDRDLATITTWEVKQYADHLTTLPSGRTDSDGNETRISAGTQRKYLNSLGNLFRRAIAEGYVAGVAQVGLKESQPGNPVHALYDKPSAEMGEAKWLEVPDAALFLEACLRYSAPPDKHPIPAALLYAIVATMLLTGGRPAEVLGLTVGDVSFERGKVTFRPHPHRRIKTLTSRRSVPLWPQLRDILLPHVTSLEHAEPHDLLFPSPRGTGMIQDLRKALDGTAKLVGWSKGEVRPNIFRHTYCAARLQTADRIIRPNPEGEDVEHWVPVSRDQVARELGHGGTTLVERVYGHVGDEHHRTDVVEYRVENHEEKLGRRLAALRLIA